MQDFTKYIQDLKKQKLEELSKELEQENAQKIESLKSELEALQIELDKKQRYAEEKQEALVNFTSSQDVEFTVETYKIEQINKFVESECKEFFKDKNNLKKFLEIKLNLLPKQKGVIKVDKSAELLKTLELSSDYKVEKSEGLGEGFVFESENYLVDATLKSIIMEIVEELRDRVYKLVTN